MRAVGWMLMLIAGLNFAVLCMIAYGIAEAVWNGWWLEATRGFGLWLLLVVAGAKIYAVSHDLRHRQ